ncbi:inositol 2-dehydrogenase [Legionella longbeachae]|uniref:Putative myo-inositol 2-dehydrogenase n=1 Tax=Legionella longbeachae serogroup 1 (strain NSW150) TaxID=661367 RepID=D3HJP4_LEGLN|nr:inositol 2-dehydrogenase [Legionella longbeachae]VEE03172.1 myo-inositol 2-dehydrogenase [Legionella oakridgensis]HBD7398974.1 inositol 2-dehydrogenase [Legionella pneumophila]ARB93928.1 inositol 2-dehydrogenase [Legionella longbeachae]ARM32934.1 inositol 2-dehydrogenase [Legionella longbeachae]EEZ94247.1 inositol 2-dehydrogenase [Legionella longbeachae D-4968]
MDSIYQQRRCRIGIIGAGRIGKLHAENIKYHLPEYELHAIADPYLDKEWASQLSIQGQYNHAEEVIFHQDLDAVLIASPSNLHVAQIKAASEADKAIFCEKPIGLSEGEIVDALNTIEANNTLLQVGFNRRFDPNFSYLKNQVQTGEIGAVHVVKITSRDPVCPTYEYCKNSGGIFMDMSIHDFDMARFLTQSEVVEVYATGAVLINPDFEALNDVDTAIIQMRFANGAMGVIDNSRQAVYGYDQRIEVFGKEGMLLATNQLKNSVFYYSNTGTEQANPKYFFLERYHQAFIAELRSFYDTWLNNKPSPASGKDGLQALRIAQAAKQSLATKLPVFLS